MMSPIRKNIWISFIIPLAAIINIACSTNPYKSIKIHPDEFKITAPFLIGTSGILINTEWGRNKKHHVLFLDNFSPSWIKSSVLQSDTSLLVNTPYNFNTSTGSGKAIHGKVGICNSLLFGSVDFENIPFYIIETATNDQTYDGALGSELMSKGIWKIDFKNNLLTFASNIDSLPEAGKCEPIPASIQDHQIKINVKFSTGITHQMFLDLGFNGDLLLPKKDFLSISGKANKITEKMQFSTPSDNRITNRILMIDTVNINNHWFAAAVTTTESANEKLIGLRFFRRFDYIIIDFKNKRLLVPKMIF